MSTRKAVDNADEKYRKPAKRARKCRTNDDESGSNNVSYASINSDCKINILSFLSSEDLNSFAICSQDCRRLRAHESLPQERTATLICTERTTEESFFNKIRDMANIFTGNRTRFKIEGFERGHGERYYSSRLTRDLSLHGVKSLVACPGAPVLNPSNERFQVDALVLLSSILPNLERLDLSETTSVNSRILEIFFCKKCPLLSSISWNQGCSMYIDNNLVQFPNIREFYADGISFYHSLASSTEDWFANFAPALVRLSIKGATLKERGQAHPAPLEQEALINMVRSHLSLHWFRSDLSAENVAMLQQERPEITFVKD